MIQCRKWLFRIFLCFIFMLLGYYLAWQAVGTSGTTLSHENKEVSLYSPLFSNHFLSIFINNVIVGLIASIGGFLTAGLLTIFVFIWNGFLLGIVVRSVYESGTPIEKIFQSVFYHGVVEIFAFLLLGVVGMAGWDFYKHIFVKQEVPKNILKGDIIKQFCLAQILLFMAAIIETYMIIYY